MFIVGFTCVWKGCYRLEVFEAGLSSKLLLHVGVIHGLFPGTNVPASKLERLGHQCLRKKLKYSMIFAIIPYQMHLT